MDRAGGTAVDPLVEVPRDLLQRAAASVGNGRRTLLGVVGPPGAGKSSLAAAVVAYLAGGAVLVPMDGFHLADAELDRLGRRDRKGAPDTFDAAGYVALLRRIVEQVDDVVYAPTFVREREAAEAGALPVPRDVPIVVTEGNYLLMDGPFASVRHLLTESWYLDVHPHVRRERLLARHMRHGRSLGAAQRWLTETDEPNAKVISATRQRADLVVRLG